MSLVLMNSNSDIWNTKISNFDLFTLTYFIIDNHVCKDTAFILFRCIQPSKYLKHFSSVAIGKPIIIRQVMYNESYLRFSKQELVSHVT